MFKRIKLFFLACRCPKFWEFYPKEDKPGPWVAVALSVTFCTRRERVKHLLNEGLQTAYIKARELALDLDDVHPTGGGEIGIEWEVRKPFPDEVYDNVPLKRS